MPFITRSSGLVLAYDIITTRTREDGTILEGNNLRPLELTRGFSFAKPDGRESESFKENVYDGRIHSMYQALDGSAWFYIRHEELTLADFKRFLAYYLEIRKTNRDIPHTIFVGDVAVDGLNENFPRKNFTAVQFELLSNREIIKGNGKSVLDHALEDMHPLFSNRKCVSVDYVKKMQDLLGVTKKPATDEPEIEKPVVKKAAPKKPVAKKTAAKKPAPKKPVAEELKVNESQIEESVIGELEAGELSQ